MLLCKVHIIHVCLFCSAGVNLSASGLVFSLLCVCVIRNRNVRQFAYMQ